MKKLTAVAVVLLVLSVAAAIGVTVWVNNSSKPVAEPQETTQATTASEPSGADSSEPVSESGTEKATVAEEASRLSLNYETTAPFKAKSKKRIFKNQSKRFKLYKTVFDKMFDAENADVFFYDITHDGQADMLVISPLVNEKTGKTSGKILQLFTVTQENTVTEIFRDYGGITASGHGFSCYVTESDGKDCLLIVKDELNDGIGKLSYSVCYVLEDGTVVTQAMGQYATPDGIDNENEEALDRYSKEAEKLMDAAHTVLFDYRYPKAVSSKADKAFGEYIK